MRLKNSSIWICLFLTMLAGMPCVFAKPDGQVRVILHAHSSISEDDISIEEVSRLAEDRGIDAVILTEYFQQKITMPGIPLHYQKASAKKYGLGQYYDDVSRVQQINPETVMIPGLEVTPHYWWSGSLWKGNWTVHDLQKNLLVAGLAPSVADALPTLENTDGSKTYSRPNIKRFQEVIDFVIRNDGIVIWSTPDESFGAEFQIGPLKFSTPPYFESLSATDGFTGIALLPDGTVDTGRIGGVWDKILNAHSQGRRNSAPWAFAEAVLHKHSLKHQIDNWDQMVISRKSSREILEALRKGQFYIRENRNAEVFLLKFVIAEGGRETGMGGTATLSTVPKLMIQTDLPPNLMPRFTVIKIIRNGILIHEYSSESPMTELEWTDETAYVESSRGYYRLEIETGPESVGKILSNPIFFNYQPDKS